MSFLKKLRAIMTKLADFFIAGREAGAWSKEDGPKIDPKGKV